MDCHFPPASAIMEPLSVSIFTGLGSLSDCDEHRSTDDHGRDSVRSQLFHSKSGDLFVTQQNPAHPNCYKLYPSTPADLEFSLPASSPINPYGSLLSPSSNRQMDGVRPQAMLCQIQDCTACLLLPLTVLRLLPAKTCSNLST